MTADDTEVTRKPAPALEVRPDAISDDTVTAHAYTLNAWDCPLCGDRNVTDADLGDEEECDVCGETVVVR